MDDGKSTQHIDPRLLEILVCPLTKQPLDYDRSANELISKAAGLAFPIVNGIPVMIPDAARKLDDGVAVKSSAP